MTPRELIHQTAFVFHDAGIPDPETDASLLLAYLTGEPFLNLRLNSETKLNDDLLSAYDHLVRQRVKRIPLQYLTGEAPFFRRVFLVDHHVLIPRPETESLCEWALEVIPEQASPRILDLCCGSGCIGLTLKAERPEASVTLSDLSADALNVAAQNADRLSLDVSFQQSDLLNAFSHDTFDLIVSNPPYIPSADCPNLQPEVLHEPLSALDGGADGCDFYRRIIQTAGNVLSSGGLLMLELGYGEADCVASLLQTYGFRQIRIRSDLNGIDRMALAACP